MERLITHGEQDDTHDHAVSTADVPAEHRFEAWHAFSAHAHPGISLDSPHRDDFVATVNVHDFRTLAISTMANYPVRARRSAARVLAHGDDLLLVTQVHSGSLVVDRTGGEVTVGPGSLVAFDWARPMTVMNQADFISTILTPRRGAARAAPVGTREPHGPGHQRCQRLRRSAGLSHDGPHPARRRPRADARYSPHLTSAIVDLLGAAARTARDGRETLASHGLRRRQVYAYIEQSLAEPGLTPIAVARAQGISIRQLDRLLRDDGTSPASYIRRSRLELCRRDLADPDLRHLPITAIGRNWGFADPAGFGRVFRREYGLCPGDYRRRFTS